MNISEFLAKKIINNKTQCKVCMILTGGGTIAISELLKHGGASEVLEMAMVPYGKESLEMAVQIPVEKSVSAKIAFKLCGGYLPANTDENILVVSCTASLKKAGEERAGRIHEAYLGFHYSKSEADIYHVVFNANRTREQEEELLATIILAGIDQYVNLRKMSIVDSIAYTAKIQKEQMGYSHLDWSDKDKIEMVMFNSVNLK